MKIEDGIKSFLSMMGGLFGTGMLPNMNSIVLQYKNIKLDIRFLSKSNSSSTGILRINLKDTDNNTDLSAYPKLLEVFGCSKDQKEEVVKEVEFDTFDPSKIKEELEKLMTEVTNSFL